MSETTENALIDLQLERFGCTGQESCFALKDRFSNRMVGKYVTDPDAKKAELVSAVIDLGKYNVESYFAEIKKVHKGAALRQANKSDKEGFVSHQFVWGNHIPDIVDINTSMEVRSGGVMRDAYLRSVEEMGGEPEEYRELKSPKCTVHNTYCWGIFLPQEGYRQGKALTNERLLAYIKFKRNGNFGLYTSILGHGDYLAHGIMHRLHHEIMRWVYAQRDGGLMRGLEYIVYGGVESGNEGLQQWKRRALFEARELVLSKQQVLEA